MTIFPINIITKKKATSRDAPHRAAPQAVSRRRVGGRRAQGSVTHFTAVNGAGLTFGLVFLYIPIVVVVVYSFNASFYANVWGGLSLKWYAQVFEDKNLIHAAFNSLKVAVLSATIATFLGTVAGISWSKSRQSWATITQIELGFALLFLPESVIGLAMLSFFTATAIPLGLTTLALAHATVNMCYVALIVEARLSGVTNELEEAATDLGCPPGKVFFLITLPLILPAVVAGWLLAFTTSLDEFIIALFVSGSGGTTLPVEIFSRLRLGITPSVNAALTLIIAIITLSLAGAIAIERYTKKRP